MKRLGMWLRLLHGRADKDRVMEDWGAEGPTFGPLDGVSGTYAADLTLYFTNKEDSPDNTEMVVLKYEGDLLVWEGMYYGDFHVFFGEQDKA